MHGIVIFTCTMHVRCVIQDLKVEGEIRHAELRMYMAIGEPTTHLTAT